MLRLSADEQSLSWETHGLAKLKKKATKRAIRVFDVLELLVGRESDVMRRTAIGAELVYVSVSLRLRASLPAPPSANCTGSGRLSLGGSLSSSSSARDTLDLTIEDEEQFGLFACELP